MEYSKRMEQYTQAIEQLEKSKNEFFDELYMPLLVGHVPPETDSLSDARFVCRTFFPIFPW